MNATKAADKLYSEIIRAGGVCTASGHRFDCAGNLQCAHIVSRRYHATRWLLNPHGAIPLCGAHHVYWTHHPLEWVEWLNAEFPGYYDEIRNIALRGTPEKAPDALIRLRALSLSSKDER